MQILGVDIGGSGIKGALVDTKRGVFLSERERIDTPESLMPDPVLETVAELIYRFQDYDGPIGIGFPAVVVDGTPRTAFTAHHIQAWVGFPVARHLSERLGRSITLLNDADAAGIAEMRFGNGRGEDGTVIVLTLGTGIGGSLFTKGHLVPNMEFGRLYLPNQCEVAEKQAAADVRKKQGLKWKQWAHRLDEYLHLVESVFSPHLIIIGGGVSKKHEKFIPRLTVDSKVIPAALRNRAGIVGAATAVAEGWSN
jgi:polyphosphate glucokinase